MCRLLTFSYCFVISLFGSFAVYTVFNAFYFENIYFQNVRNLYETLTWEFNISLCKKQKKLSIKCKIKHAIAQNSIVPITRLIPTTVVPIRIFIIYLQKIPLDTTYFPTQKYKIPYQATNVIFSVSPSYIFTHLEKIQHLMAASESD